MKNKRRSQYLSLFLVTLLILTFPMVELSGEQDHKIDPHSYNLGVIGAFSEVVSLGIKRMAFSAALAPDQMASILYRAQEIVKKNKALCYLEKDLIVTDLFPKDVAKGKEVLIIYTGEWLDQYLALKKEKTDLVKEGKDNPKNRRRIAFQLGHLLSYSNEKIQELLNEVPIQGKVSNLDTPQKVINELYRLVSWPAGTTPDWDQLKNLFLEEGLIILKSRSGFNLMDREGFIDLWLQDVKKYQLQKTGFSEVMVAIHLEQVGDMAHCLAVYGASIPTLNRPPQLGVDCYHLIKKDKRWWITSVINEVLRPGVIIPEPLREKTEEFIKRMKEKFSKSAQK